MTKSHTQSHTNSINYL